jgi:hypothetical protein
MSLFLADEAQFQGDALSSGVRRFLMIRKRDVSGVSGTGVVAEGVIFTQGWAVLHWLVEPCSVAVYQSINDLIAIHGHNGATDIQFLDTSHARTRPCKDNGG